MISDIDRAERKSQARAVCMALLALVTALSSTFGFDGTADTAPTLRGGMWLLLMGLAILILATGGALNLKSRLRVLMNDELSLANRRRALTLGFHVAMLVAAVLYVVSWSVPIDLRAGLRLLTGLAIAAALARYAMLEWV